MFGKVRSLEFYSLTEKGQNALPWESNTTPGGYTLGGNINVTVVFNGSFDSSPAIYVKGPCETCRSDGGFSKNGYIQARS